MRLARTASIYNSIRDDHASRAQSGANPRDRWPNWTDNSFAPMAEADDRPELSADATPRRQDRKGGGR